VADDTQADLIVMGTVGHTDLARILIGSVTEKVTRHLPCSIVTVKAQDAMRLPLESDIADVEAHCKQGRELSIEGFPKLEADMADVDTHFKEGCELLAEGFPKEAILQFERCVDKDMMFAEAWEALAEAHEHLGHVENSKQYHEQAKWIHLRIENRRIEAAIRRETWGTKGGKT
jgi:universal stress protein E